MTVNRHSFIAAIAAVTVLFGASVASAEQRLTFTSSATPTQASSIVLSDWAEKLSENTDGELTVEFFWQQSLSKLADNLDAIANGLADMGTVVPAYSKKDMPLTYLSSTSFKSGDPYVVAQAWMETREQFPQIVEEERELGIKLIAVNSIGPVLFVGDKHYVTPDDFDGATMRLSSHFSRAAGNEGWNVNPARIRSPETYTSLEKGTITGATTYANQIFPFKLNEVADHITILDLGQHMNMIYASLDTWEGLSDEHRGIIEESMPQLMLDLARAEIDFAKESVARAETDPTYPVKVMTLDSDDRSVWTEALRASFQSNVDDAANINPVANEIAEHYTTRIDELSETVADQGYPWSGTN